MENSQEKPHAIMVPYPLLGHIIPAVHLATKIASKGFMVTFINTESIHHQIVKAASHAHDDDRDRPRAEKVEEDYDIFFEARQSGLDIRYTTVSDGFPLGFDRPQNHDQFMQGFLHVFSAHIDELVGKIVQTDRVHCLIVDTFFVWPSMIASKYKLVNVSFWTEPALIYTLYYHLDLLRANGHFDCLDNREDTIDYIPGVEAIKPKDLMSYLQATDTTTVVHQIIYKAIFEDSKKADFILCNTVQELEPATISALQQKQPFYAIGPIFPSTGFTDSTVPTSLWSQSDCTRWLQTKPHGSVLYVSFGSYAHCSKQEVAEIALGLLLSGVSFIWVLRPDIKSSDDTDFLPVGFETEIKDRGLIVPWCRQNSVISNPTVGGFLTHCGWNSILESIWCSVPLLCYPLLTDQFTNRKLVVDDWKIGINLCDKKPLTRDEVADKIKILMRGNSGNGLRENIKRMKEMAEVAISTVGSSEKNFNQFISDVKVRIQEKRH